MIMELCPEPNAVMQIAWRDCLLWTIGSKNPDFLSAFTADTGVCLPFAPKSGLDAMIDEATGINKDFAEAYIGWFNKAVWGNTGEDA